MTYEKTPVNKKVSKQAIDKAVKISLDDMNTGQILLTLIKRHKFGLVSAYAIWLTFITLMPWLPSAIGGLF
jgi:hypothetical protein